ncbi:MAG: hypothetical protein ACREBV_00760 [Candidatus Zixiibacteriota bacterium]
MISKNNGTLIFAIGFPVLIALACADYGDPPTGPDPSPPIDTVSFAAEIHDTLAFRCVCHAAEFAEGGLSMGDFSWSSMRAATGPNGPIIIPGDGSSSNFYLKTTSTPPFGARMPQDALPFLSLETQAVIRDWIDQGALDN